MIASISMKTNTSMAANASMITRTSVAANTLLAERTSKKSRTSKMASSSMRESSSMDKSNSIVASTSMLTSNPPFQVKSDNPLAVKLKTEIQLLAKASGKPENISYETVLDSYFSTPQAVKYLTQKY